MRNRQTDSKVCLLKMTGRSTLRENTAIMEDTMLTSWRKTWPKALISSMGLCCLLALAAVPAARGQNVPRYKVDPFWPKELPNNWLLQGVPRLAVDKDDHIWIISREADINFTAQGDAPENGAAQDPPTALCCKAPPAVLEFDQEGNLLKSWGGAGYVPGWPQRREHALLVDKKGNVWVGGNDPGDTLVQFTPDGKFIRDMGHRAPAIPAEQRKDNSVFKQDNNQQTEYFTGGVVTPAIDDDAHEFYMGDYVHRRVMVYDLDTGAFKRGWGGHGMPLSEISNDPLPPFDPAGPPRNDFTSPVHCIHISADGLVYVCNRGGDSIQVFTKQGKFVNELFLHRMTPKGGTRVFELAFSPDPKQQFLFVADGTNNMVWILNRNDGKVVGSVGHFGRSAGQFHFLDGIAIDSKGNLYTGEVGSGKRVQKFVPQK
jgi:hypothetical protein